MLARITVALVLLAACGESHEAGDASVDAADEPRLERPSPRPSVADGAAGPEVVLLLSEVHWNQRDDWADIGLDLDGLVTTDSDPSTAECVAPSPTGETLADGTAGTDNAFGRNVLPILLLIHEGAEPAARSLQAMGIGALLVRIRDWTGADDDPNVIADVFWTTGLDAAGGVLVSESTVLDGDLERPRMRDDAAYVASRVLVTRLPDRAPLEIAFGDSTVPVGLTDATLVVPLDGPATLAGRWSLSDLLGVASSFGLCPGSDEEASISRLLGLAADIRAIPGSGGPGQPCDAISVGIELAVAPATLAGIGPAPELTPPCP